MNQKPEIKFVRYVFQRSALLEGEEYAYRYDEEASAEKYADQCREALKEAYPGVEIEVLDVEEDENLQTQVLALIDGDELEFAENDKIDQIDSYQQVEARWRSLEFWENSEVETSEQEEHELIEESESVEALCEAVRKEYRWLVRLDLISAPDAYRRYDIPVAIIDWACQEGIIDAIDEARRVTGYWEFTPDAFVQSRLYEDQTLRECSGLIGGRLNDDRSAAFMCYPQDLLQVSDLSFLDQEVDILFVPTGQIDVPLLEDCNTSASIQKSYSEINVTIVRFRDDDTWMRATTFDVYSHTLMKQLDLFDSIQGNCNGEKWVGSIQLQVFYPVNSATTLQEMVDEASQELRTAMQDADLALSRGPVWKKIYEKKEEPFCREVLEPLLRKLGYEYVQYTGGPREGGKDFVFSRRTRFGGFEHYGLQAKAGDMSGAVNSPIDKIVGQIEDAFSLPYQEPGSEEEKSISVFIVAISGHFTPQAQKKIIQKMPGWARGSVYFWDKAKIQSLISSAWSEDLNINKGGVK
jgi:hypothetical protein